LLAACAKAPDTTAALPPREARTAVVAAAVPPPIAEAPRPAPPPAPPDKPPPPSIVVPPDALYVCAVDAGGTRQQTAIEFTPKVAAMCAKHPEMGPCQYERNACRQRGGRVFAGNGVEVTTAMEAEYDRKVLRVRLKAG